MHDIQHSGFKFDTKHKRHSESSVVMLNAVMTSFFIVTVNVVMLNVFILNVVAPDIQLVQSSESGYDKDASLLQCQSIWYS